MRAALSFLACAGTLVPCSLAQTISFNQTDIPIIYQANMFKPADLNRDGFVDFEFGLTVSFNIYTLLADEKGGYLQWHIPTTYCPATPLGFGDFQRNGKNDVLVGLEDGVGPCGGSNRGSFANLLNDGTGIFPQSRTFASRATGAAVVADFNSDHKLDVAVVNNEELDLFYGDGWGNFFGPYLITTVNGSVKSPTGFYYNLVAGDFDGDGCTDLAWIEFYLPTSSSTLMARYGDCHGNFTQTTPSVLAFAGGVIDSLRAADMDRDGITDLVMTIDSPSTIGAYQVLTTCYGQKDRTFQGSRYISDPGLTAPIAVADFNGDGYPDIAYISSTASGKSVKILTGDSQQLFLVNGDQVLTGPANDSILQMEAGDFNRSGKMDLALLTAGYANSPQDFALLTNTSAFANGVCVPPVTPGIHVCSPGATSPTTVNVLAAGTNDNPTVYMELWVDGVKQIGSGGTHELRTTLTLPTGVHRFAYFAIDAAGLKTSFKTNVTVQ